MQAVNILTEFEPEFAMNRLLPSAAGQLVVPCVTPAHREKANADGLFPVGNVFNGTIAPDEVS